MKTVLITGASSGMGKETAKTLLRDGYTVYAVARRIEKMRDIEALGARTMAMDITQADDISRVVDEIASRSGGVDILINNAGFGMYGAMEDTTLDDARYQFEVNLFGLARLTQGVLPHMREQSQGTILNISSMGGKIYTPLGAWYHATKHAIEGWSDCLRLELAPFGIRVIIIEPGAIQTEFGDVMVGPMLDRSGHTAYAELAHRVAVVTRKSYQAGEASPPSVIAQLIRHVLKVRNPRPRYAAGKYAKVLIALRKWLGDRLFDRIIMSQY